MISALTPISNASYASRFGMAFRVVENKVVDKRVVPYEPAAGEVARPMSDIICPRRYGNRIVNGLMAIAVPPYAYAYAKNNRRTVVADGFDAVAISKIRESHKPSQMTLEEHKLWLQGAKKALGWRSFTRWLLLPRKAVIGEQTKVRESL